MLLVAVEVGHQYAAPGAIAPSGKAELEFNQELAAELREELARAGFDVRIIEESADAVREAGGARLLISLHHEVRGPKDAAEAGFSLFISRLNAQPWKSLRCASAIGVELRAAGEAPSRYHADPALGAQRATADKLNGVHFFDELRGLRGAMPAVQVEAGLIVGREEEQRLRDPLVRRGIARAISGGVRSCLR